MKQSNYELTKRRMQGHFLDFDQNTMIRRFGLQHDAEYLYIRFVGRLYRIDRKTGRVQWSWDDFAMELTGASTRPCPFMTFCAAPRRDAGCLRIWDFVGFHCRGTGRELFSPQAGVFQEGPGSSSVPLPGLGGVAEGKGMWRIACQYSTVCRFRLSFWEADEDFPPSLQFQWDRNTTDFIHFETTFYVTSIFWHGFRS